MDFLENLENAIKKTINKNAVDIEKMNIEIKSDQGASPFSQEEVELAKKLDAIEKFTIDRFEENIAVLENRETGEMIDVNKKDLPENIQEGIILKKINGKYFVDEKLNKETAKRLEDKLKDFWN